MTYRPFWGDLHNHCSISYGHGTVEQAVLRARQQLDFCSITGHAFWPDMPTDRDNYGEIIDYHNVGFGRLARNWDKLLDSLHQANRPGEFVTFPSYEWHSLKYGDHNIYSPRSELPLRDAADLPTLREICRKHGAVAIPHHIGYAAGYRGVDWDHYREDRSPFVEAYSLHGCSVSGDAAYPMLHDMGPRDAGSTAEAGWAQGHRFGIVAGTDHHGAYPGSHGDGVMGVFATALTRDALWDAFLARRVFALTGDRIDARLFVDDAWIGSEIRAPEPRQVRVQVRAADAIQLVELLKNGRVVGRFFPTPESSQAASGRYRLRITWGWGRKDRVVKWDGQFRLSEGSIVRVESCFSGQPIVAPKAQVGNEEVPDDVDLPHAVTELDGNSCAWRSVTKGNPTMRHATTQALSLEIEAPRSARVTVAVNGCEFQHPLEELLAGARSHYLRGWLSEAICIGPLVPIEECAVDAEFTDAPESETDMYRLQVAQRNGQWAWLTPIWAMR